MWKGVEIREWRVESESVILHSPLSTLCFIFILILTGCRQVAPVVKVGLVAPFEGRERAIGYDAIYAARLAIREVNEVAGKGRVRVALVALDDGGDPRLARQAAAAVVTDPDIMIVLGHWLPETTAAAEEIYIRGGLPLIRLGAPPLTESDPGELPASFREAYAAVTPFDETAGSYAGATYDGLSLALHALEVAESEGAITRESVATALDRLQYDGLTGPVHAP